MLNGFPFIPLPAPKPDAENISLNYLFPPPLAFDNHKREATTVCGDVAPKMVGTGVTLPKVHSWGGLMLRGGRGYCPDTPTAKKGTGWKFEPSNTSSGYYGKHLIPDSQKTYIHLQSNVLI